MQLINISNIIIVYRIYLNFDGQEYDYVLW